MKAVKKLSTNTMPYAAHHIGLALNWYSRNAPIKTYILDLVIDTYKFFNVTSKVKDVLTLTA
jgi:hypothetical protein